LLARIEKVKSPRKTVLTVVQFILGVIIIIILLHQANMPETIGALIKADIRYVVTGSLLIITASMMIALSFYFILTVLKYRVSFSSCVQANFAGQLASDLTPGRAGYFITPFIMGALSKTPVEPCAVATVVSGMVDFFIRAFLTVISIVYLIGPVESISGVQWIVATSAFILATSAVFFAVLLWSDRPRKLIIKLRGFKRISQFLDPYVTRFENFQREGVKAKKSLVPVAFAMLLTSLFDSMALFFFSLSVGVDLHPILFIFIYSLVSSFTYLPLTLAGLGVQEGVLAALLQLFGVPLSHGVSISLLFRFFYTVTDFIGLPPILKIGLSKVFDKTQM